MTGSEMIGAKLDELLGSLRGEINCLEIMRELGELERFAAAVDAPGNLVTKIGEAESYARAAYKTRINEADRQRYVDSLKQALSVAKGLVERLQAESPWRLN